MAGSSTYFVEFPSKKEEDGSKDIVALKPEEEAFLATGMAKLLHLKRPRLALTRTTNDEDDDMLETTKRRKVGEVRKMELAAEMEWALY